jgi:RNA-binding protein Musashi
MESDLGKLFVGGISWDTDEDRLKEHFRAYGEVLEAVIMRDRTTGRARGFGFVVFADPLVAERVVTEKHLIDGRNVEAKKAVPRDESTINKNNSSIQGSSSPGRTKKIFVGGLASTVTENDFKNYFDQFGTITDVVVMYDHNTQRPRGFGFITYDSEEAVDWVLHRTFHELNGKMVEVKRAVPKELSPSPNRSPLIGYNNNGGLMNRPNNNLLASYAQLGAMTRFNLLASGRTGFSPFGSPSFGMGMNLEPGMTSNFNNNIGLERALSPYYGANSTRYNTPIGYSGMSGRISDSLLNSTTRNLWANGGLNNPSLNSGTASLLGSGDGNVGAFGNRGANWGSFQGVGRSSGYGNSNSNLGSGQGSESGFGLGLGNNMTSSAIGGPSRGADFEGSIADLYQGGSLYNDLAWAPDQVDGSTDHAFGYGLANDALQNSDPYVANYGIANRQSLRGIAA